MKSRLMAGVLALGLTVSSVPLSAHHSTTMYNMAAPTTVTGVVKKFDWTIYLKHSVLKLLKSEEV